MTIATIALVGNPNAGKTSLFNALTGARQKVANYAGVTVERKSGPLHLPDGREVELIDLPGTYSLTPGSPDEAVTTNVLEGVQSGERKPDVVLCVIDATNLANHLRFVLELQSTGLPMVLALNMVDLAARDGLRIDAEALSQELGIPVIETIAVRRRGLEALLAALPQAVARPAPPQDVRSLARDARQIARRVTTIVGERARWTQRIDGIVLHPVAGPALLAGLLFVVFQAVFAWAEAPMTWIESGFSALQARLAALLPEGLLLSFLSDGVLTGVGSVVVFLPQILILFAFILLLEQSGYMARAAFLMDRLMAGVGLNGRAFIPLLSSFACAIPGIMATRAIADERDRLTTILVAPLMTCSARLPVYAIIIAAFIPNRHVGGVFGLQGLVLFGLYAAGILGALGVAWVLRRSVTRGKAPTFLMELPKYQVPQLRDLGLELLARTRIFLHRAGTIILVSLIILWVLATFPAPPAGATGPAIDYSIAGWLARGLEVLFAPIGFNKEIALALVPGMAAREVAVGALGTVYALQGSEDVIQRSLVETLRHAWTLPTALAFLAWYVFAPQCLSTLAITRRETNSWRWPLFMAGYLFALAYAAAGLTYWTARWLGA